MVEKITRNDIAMILIDKTPGISMDEIITNTLKLNKPFELGIPNNSIKRSLVRESVDEMISLGFIKETTERYGSVHKIYYGLTDKGRKVKDYMLGKLITMENIELANNMHKYFGM